MYEKLQMFCDLAHTTGLPVGAIFTPTMSRSAIPIAQVTFQSPRRTRRSKIFMSCCVAHVADAVIKARCRIVKARIRLWLVMKLCYALHNFRVRLPPWQPMV